MPLSNRDGGSNCTELPDRLLTILLERLAETGGALAHNQVTGN